jgi:hypothetical protein
MIFMRLTNFDDNRIQQVCQWLCTGLTWGTGLVFWQPVWIVVDASTFTWLLENQEMG